MTKLYEAAKDVASMLIDEEGPNPERLSIHEMSRERAEMDGLDHQGLKDLEGLVGRLVFAAVTTVTFPDEGEL